ncbi:MAG: hypothetical protein ACXVEF_17475 [Polyangiales bacterium]
MLCAAVVAGCSSSNSDVTPGTDSGESDTGGGDTGSAADTGSIESDTGDASLADSSDAGADSGALDGSVCPTFANTAPTITDVTSTATVPVGTGGSIVDGTYFMTSHTTYVGGDTTIKKHSYTIKIVGGVFQLVGHDNTAADGAATFAITNNASTGAFDLSGTCPADVIGQHLGALDSYTADATTLHMYSSSKKNDVVLTKQ